MFFQANRYIREIFIEELQKLFNEHPFYGLNKQKKFEKEPMLIADSYNFDGRSYPSIIVKSTSTKEYRLSMDKLIEEVRGHVRIHDMLPFIVAKVEDDAKYTGTYIDSVVKLEFVNVNKDNDRQLVLRTTTLAAPSGSPEVIQYFDNVKPNQWRTDLIPGARVYFNSYNDFETGKTVYVDTFQNPQYLGDQYGTGYDSTVELDVYGGTQYEAEDVLDILTAFFIYIMPQHLYDGYGIVTKTASNTNVIEKEGKVGEEFYKGTFSIVMFMEHQFFVPQPTVDGYVVYLQLREQLDQLTDSETIEVIST